MNFLIAFLIYILLSMVMSILIGKMLKVAASDDKIFKWILNIFMDDTVTLLFGPNPIPLRVVLASARTLLHTSKYAH